MRDPIVALLLSTLCLLALPAPAEADDDCGCTAMTVSRGDNGQFSRAYCAPDAGEIPPGCVAINDGQLHGCQVGQTPYHCRLGPINPPAGQAGNFGWGFEVVVTLTAGSDPSLCPEGQFNSLTQTESGSLIPNPEAGAAPPAAIYNFSGGFSIQTVTEPDLVPRLSAKSAGGLPLMAADGFTGPDVNKRHDEAGGQVYWVDTPLISISADDNLQWNNAFVSFVNGNSLIERSCWCLFAIRRTYNDGTIGGTGLTFVQGENCQVVP